MSTDSSSPLKKLINPDNSSAKKVHPKLSKKELLKILYFNRIILYI